MSSVCAQWIWSVMVHIRRTRAVLGHLEDVSPAGGGTFYRHLHVHNTMARCVPDRPAHASDASASHANQLRRIRREAGCRFPHCLSMSCGSRLSRAQVVPEWPEGVKRRVHTKTGDSQCLAACGVLHCIELCHLSLDNGVGNRQCQTPTWVC
jgi:hypothetical protein